MKATKKEIKNARKRTDVELFLNPEESFYSIKDMRRVPCSLSDMVKLAGILTRWAKKATSFSLEQFCCEQEIPYSAFKRWRTQCPELEEAAQYAKLYLGIRRENGALTNKLNQRMVQLTAPHYLPRLKDDLEYLESIKKDASGSTSTQPVINVIMPPAKVTDIVPEKPPKVFEGIHEKPPKKAPRELDLQEPTTTT